MASYGIPHADISSVIGLERKALERHYETELANATAEANTKVATRLFDRAMDGDVKAMMFWLERRGGDAWRNKPVVQLVPGDFTIDMNPADFLELPGADEDDDD